MRPSILQGGILHLLTAPRFRRNPYTNVYSQNREYEESDLPTEARKLQQLDRRAKHPPSLDNPWLEPAERRRRFNNLHRHS